MAHSLSRRSCLIGVASALSLFHTRAVMAADATLTFEELYASFSALGLQFSDKVKTLEGKTARIEGFMAPPLKAESNFFVLTQIPMALCPFCSSDADWPDNIMVVYLKSRQTFTDPNELIVVKGTLEKGSWTDPDTGFLSQLRLRDATFGRA